MEIVMTIGDFVYFEENGWLKAYSITTKEIDNIIMMFPKEEETPINLPYDWA